MTGQTVAYTRVSSVDQHLDRQRASIRDACEAEPDRWFEDKASGGSTDRPALSALLAHVREGDCVTVASMDRLGPVGPRPLRPCRRPGGARGRGAVREGRTDLRPGLHVKHEPPAARHARRGGRVRAMPDPGATGRGHRRSQGQGRLPGQCPPPQSRAGGASTGPGDGGSAAREGGARDRGEQADALRRAER